MRKSKGELATGRFIVPYRVYGHGDATIICLSGAKQTMSAWRSLVSYFRSGYRIIVFDMPGQGRAEIVSGSSGVSLDEQIDVLSSVIKELSVDEAPEKHLFGGSWGSVVAAAYLARHPETFDKAILGSFGTKPNLVLSMVMDRIEGLIESGRGKDIAPLMIEQFGQHIPEALKQQIVAQFNEMKDEQFQSLYEHSVAVKKMGDLARFVDLPAIRAETLIVMGKQDTIMDLFDAKKAAAKIPNSHYMLIEGAGHFLHWENPDLLPLYREFLECGLGQLESPLVSSLS